MVSGLERSHCRVFDTLCYKLLTLLLFCLGIPVWILLAVVVPVTVITTTILTLTVFIWCSIDRKRPSRTKQETPKLQVVEDNATSNHQQSAHSINFDQSQKDSRKSEHIYAIPWNRDSSGSMLYNQAYQESFVLTINTAYSSSTE